MRLFLFLCFVFLFGVSSNAQDVLYTTAGNKFQVKIVEINSTDIKYKELSNLEGPTYVISKSEIVLIQYPNGVVDVLNNNPPNYSPQKTELVTSRTPAPEKKKLNLYYLNNNLLSINALALANGDVTLIYDRELVNGHVGVSFLGGYNFNSRMGGLNLFIADSKDNAKKKFDAGLGINLMPRTTKRVQYFVGLLGKYMAYDYNAIIDSTNNQLKYQKASGYQLAIMLTNGWVYRVSPNFNFKIFGSIGGAINAPKLKQDYVGAPKVYLGYCFGYRF